MFYKIEKEISSLFMYWFFFLYDLWSSRKEREGDALLFYFLVLFLFTLISGLNLWGKWICGKLEAHTTQNKWDLFQTSKGSLSRSVYWWCHCDAIGNLAATIFIINQNYKKKINKLTDLFQDLKELKDFIICQNLGISSKLRYWNI